MADDPKPDPAPDPDPKPDPKPDPAPDPKPDDEVFDKDRAMATIKKLRDEVKEAKKTGGRVAELEAKLQAIEDAEKTELEKAQAKLAEHEAKVATANQRLQRANLIVELSKPEHGLVNAAAAAKLLDGVEYDDDGAPTNLTEILPAFLEENAFLKGEPGKPKPPNLNGGGGGGDEKPPPLTADELAWAAKLDMTAEEYAAYKAGPVMTEADAQKLRTAAKT